MWIRLPMYLDSISPIPDRIFTSIYFKSLSHNICYSDYICMLSLITTEIHTQEGIIDLNMIIQIAIPKLKRVLELIRNLIIIFIQ